MRTLTASIFTLLARCRGSYSPHAVRRRALRIGVLAGGLADRRMSAMLQVMIASVALFLDGVLAGVFVASAMVEHAVRHLGGTAWLEYKQAKEVVFAAVMPPFMLAGIGASLVAAIVGPGQMRFAIATTLLVATLGLTLVVHLPLNKAFMIWPANDPPARWMAARQRWRAWNLLRTVMVVAAFAVTLA